MNGSSQLKISLRLSGARTPHLRLGILQVCGVLSERCGWRRVRLESVADWLAASDPGPQLTSSDYPGPALTFDLP